MRNPDTPPALEELVADETDSSSLFRVLSNVGPVDGKGRYLHWDDLRNYTPPEGLNHRQWWLGTTFARRALPKELPLHSIDGSPIRYELTLAHKQQAA